MAVGLDASGIQFDFEWEPADRVTSPELRATWARLSIVVNGEVLTQVEDAATGSVRKSIYVPLYPLAEWIVFNWWALRSDSRPSYLPERNWSFRSRLRLPRHRTEWLLHHNLRAIGEGLPWPDASILPSHDDALIAWQRDRTFLPDWRVRFVGTGRAVVPIDQVAEALAGVVEAVLARLEEEGVRDTALGEEWSALQGLDAEEIEFCVAASRLGLDPFSTSSDIADLIVESAVSLSEVLLDDFLDAATPTALREQVEWVQHHWAAITKSPVETEPLPREVAAPPLSNGPAWLQGLEDARRLRSSLGVKNDRAFDVLSWIHLDRVDPASKALQAVGAYSSSGGRIMALAAPTSMSDERARFAAARALWRFLHLPGGDGFLVTSARTPTQQAERAFAAELLAPSSGIAELLGSDEDQPIELESIRPVSDHFQVSDWVIEYQLLNQLGRDVEDIDLPRIEDRP